MTLTLQDQAEVKSHLLEAEDRLESILDSVWDIMEDEEQELLAEFRDHFGKAKKLVNKGLSN